MKKTLLLAAAAILALQAVPAFAGPEGGKKHGERGDKMFEKIDANKDGTISAEENAAFSKKKFDEMDGNKDGSVTKDEAKAHHEAKRAEWEAKKAEMKAKAGEKPTDGPVTLPPETPKAE